MSYFWSYICWSCQRLGHWYYSHKMQHQRTYLQINTLDVSHSNPFYWQDYLYTVHAITMYVHKYVTRPQFSMVPLSLVYMYYNIMPIYMYVHKIIVIIRNSHLVMAYSDRLPIHTLTSSYETRPQMHIAIMICICIKT